MSNLAKELRKIKIDEAQIGALISGEELKKVLDRQSERDKFVKQVEEELKALKPGECRLYKSRPEAPLWASVGLALLEDKIKGLKTIKEENRTYIYREK
ncbi:unnamed protein product [marine sediment metagenome]|uniref:Uncharacterized protein n=1 Tax=marine sediment metagenome TaxID=412755 RepID=X1GLC1_9ZZZZ